MEAIWHLITEFPEPKNVILDTEIFIVSQAVM